MRTGGIIRIIISLLVAVALTAFLVLSLGGVNVFQQLGWDGRWDRWRGVRAPAASNSTFVTSNEPVSIQAADVYDIDIGWTAGVVELRVGTGDEIIFYESSGTNLTDATRMRYSLSNGKLRIRYCDETKTIWSWFNRVNIPTKDLFVTIPAAMIGSLSQLEVDTVSANIDAEGVYGGETSLETISGNIDCVNLSCDKLDLSTTSGAIKALDCATPDLEIDSVSGNATAEGSFTKIEADTVSGSIKLRCLVTPENLSGDSVSGDMTVQLPEGSSFTAQLDTVSGELSCELPGTMGKNRIVCGDGSNSYRLDTVSGNVRIQKLS